MIFVKKKFLSKILHVFRKILKTDYKTVFLFKINSLQINSLNII
jgi:hypothetical protein